ncbi:MAG: metallophosphoesterase [Candidatus Omnitrophota bacterium]
MKLLLLHLSDLHFKEGFNQVLARKEKIFDSFKNIAKDCDSVYMIATGDLAYSGLSIEYEKVHELFDFLKERSKEYLDKELEIVMVPGNHDCDFQNHSVRDNIARDVIDNKIQDMDDEIFEECCKIQTNYFNFSEKYQGNGEKVFNHKLLKILKFTKNQRTIYFNCYNTSWLSQKYENPGTLMFPIDFFKEKLSLQCPDLSISILHHPLNWFNPSNSRTLKSYLHNSSTIILTGHDHSQSKSQHSNLLDSTVEYIEGDILQDEKEAAKSGFNLLIIDLEKKEQCIMFFKWAGEAYISNDKLDNFIPLNQSIVTEKTFLISAEFSLFLDNVGELFHHPEKTNLKLSDIFIFPNLQKLNFRESKNHPNIYSSEIIFCDGNIGYLLLLGSEKSGKTSICKKLFSHYYKKDYVPVFIDGHQIKSASMVDFDKLLKSCFEKQYSEKAFNNYFQLDNLKKIIIIDDFDKSKLNAKYKCRFLASLNKNFKNIIITTNELFQIEKIVYNKDQENVFGIYKQYKILEFGHQLRSKLINNWYVLGREEIIENDELFRKHDRAKQIVDAVIGKNFVPSYPLFLLTILQTIETVKPEQIRASSYGYYYEFLVTQALGRYDKRNEEIDASYNYLTELAYYFFEHGINEISQSALRDFHSWYCKEFAITTDFRDVVEKLNHTSMIEEQSNIFRFCYKYIYYFFVARYLANNITKTSIKSKISSMCSALYNEEAANIIMFLTHHSKDPFILEEILKNAKLIFAEFKPIEFLKDIDSINKLNIEIPRLVLEERDVEKNREQSLCNQDEQEMEEEEKKEANSSVVVDSNPENLDYIAKFNMAFKTIEILGQIMKNYYGSLHRQDKYQLCEEAYFMGLRSINSFFSFLEKNMDSAIDDIKKIIKSRKVIDRNKIENLSRKSLFEIVYLFSYGLIKSISNYIGSEKLSETYKEVLEKNDTIATRMIDISIKLDFFREFPLADIKNINKKLANNILPQTILKALVINYIYMFPTSYKDKQRICKHVDIPMSIQRSIEKRRK